MCQKWGTKSSTNLLQGTNNFRTFFQADFFKGPNAFVRCLRPNSPTDHHDRQLPGRDNLDSRNGDTVDARLCRDFRNGRTLRKPHDGVRNDRLDSNLCRGNLHFYYQRQLGGRCLLSRRHGLLQTPTPRCRDQDWGRIFNRRKLHFQSTRKRLHRFLPRHHHPVLLVRPRSFFTLPTRPGSL